MFRIAVLFTLLAGCGSKHHTISSASHREATPQRAAECTKLCTDLGMKMTAMVVIMSHAGCVCEPIAATARTSTNGAVATAGIAVINDVQQQAAQAAAQQKKN